jgi:hypothetical protein
MWHMGEFIIFTSEYGWKNETNFLVSGVDDKE